MKRGDGHDSESKRKFTELRAMFEQNRNGNGSSNNSNSYNNGFDGYSNSNSNSNAGSASVSRKGSSSTIESQTSTATANSAATTNSNSRSAVSTSSIRSSNSASSGSTSKQKPKPVLIVKAKISTNSLTASILSTSSSGTSSASSILSSAENSPPATSPPRRVSSPLVPAGKRSLPSVPQQMRPSDKNSKMTKENAKSNTNDNTSNGNSSNTKNNHNNSDSDYGYISVRRVVYEVTGDTAEIAIDTSIRLAATVKNCALRFAITDVSEHENLVLRVDKGPVITDSHALGIAIKDSPAILQLVVSPRRKASILLRDLQAAEADETENATKAALFKIVGQMSDKEVAAEFINQNGIVKLTKMIASQKLKGSTVSLALTAIQSLLDIHQLQDIFSLSLDSAPFITILLTIIEQQQQIMVSRPATSLLIKLLDSKNSVSRILQAVYTYISRSPPQQQQQQQQSSSFSRTLVSRLALRDFSLQSISLSLINTLIHKSLETQTIVFSLFAVFEANGLRNEIASLVYSLPEANNALQVTEVRKLIVEFQRLLVKEWNRRKRANVVISPGSKHEQMLIEIWKVAGLEIDGTGAYKWRRLGFDTDVPRKELSRVGVLGLEIICAFALSHVEYYTRFMYEQSVKTAEKRIPFVKASAEVLEVLFEHWEISTGYTTSSTMQPLLLEFERVFSITLRLYFRLWLEMEAQSSSDDVSRVGATVRSHFKFCMSTNQVSDVHEFTLFEREMLSTPYSVIKDRQMNELNNDFALLEERPFRILRDKLKENNYKFIKEQRITCLLNGAWFPSIKERRRAKNLYRFYRLNSNRELLHYGDFKEIISLPSLDQLPHKSEFITYVGIC
ncbi:hypothetical protein HK100_003085 [Physocladia obscura]|uniref:ELMO domain-containing protein n=1 Tax=Physocladia obscura TaxID=109957 RepID=A0AAD5SUV8_9FUNG|nr:hypothetical protein HK100_003085 [Physocladia obscura]